MMNSKNQDLEKITITETITTKVRRSKQLALRIQELREKIQTLEKLLSILEIQVGVSSNTVSRPRTEHPRRSPRLLLKNH